MSNGNKNDKERLFEMTDSPEQFSDGELRDALQSENKEDSLNSLSALKRATAMSHADLSEDEVDRQWQAFEAKHPAVAGKKQTGTERYWLKAAAMFTGVIMIAGMAIAAINIVKGNRQDSSVQAETELNADRMQADGTGQDTAMPDTTGTKGAEATTVVLFDDVELGDILNDIAAHYGIKLKYENEQARHIKMFFKWNKQADIAAIIEILNSYDRISMELNGNTLTIK